MKRTTFVTFAALAGIAGGAHAGVDEISTKAADMLSRYEPTGEVENCVQMRRIDQIRGAGRDLLLVELTNGQYYVNQTNGACESASRINQRLEFKTTVSMLCSGDIVTVVDNSSNIMTGTCSLGRFEKLREKKAPTDVADQPA